MKQIPLGGGHFTLVDDKDFEELSKYKWRLSKSDKGHYYARRSSYRETGKKTHVFMHRQTLNPPKGMPVDHINNNGLDNRRSNIRVVTTSQNIIRIPKVQTGISKYKGVRFSKARNGWYANFEYMGKRYFRGYFKTEEEAALAYNRLAVLYQPGIAHINMV